MRQALPLLFFVSILLNCKQSTLTPNSTSDSSNVVTATGYRKVHIETIVILGSSTAEGYGASSYKYSWAGLITNRLLANRVVNLAKAGYTSYQILPSGTNNPSNRPKIDTLRNITAALKQKPTTLIISMTTNDVANGFNVDEIIKNFNVVKEKALAAGVTRVFITTSHPRKINAGATAQYMLQRDLVLKTYGASAINFFDPVADSTNLFRSELLSADGIHPNDKGHKVLYDEIKKALKY